MDLVKRHPDQAGAAHARSRQYATLVGGQVVLGHPGAVRPVMTMRLRTATVPSDRPEQAARRWPVFTASFSIVG